MAFFTSQINIQRLNSGLSVQARVPEVQAERACHEEKYADDCSNDDKRAPGYVEPVSGGHKLLQEGPPNRPSKSPVLMHSCTARFEV